MKRLLFIAFIIVSFACYSQTKVYKLNSTLLIGNDPSSTKLLNKSNLMLFFSGSKVGFIDNISRQIEIIDHIDSIKNINNVDVGDSIQSLIYLTELIADIPSSSFYLDISKGVHPEISSEFKFGRNPDLGTTEEVVWDGGGSYNFLDTARYISVKSTNLNDSIGKDGAWNVIMYGLDSLFNQQSEVIVLRGTVPVISTKKYRRLFRAFILNSGLALATGDNNLGDISFTSVGSVVALQAMIKQHNGQTLMCVYTTPKGKTGFITGISFNVGQGKQALFRGKFRNCKTDNCTFTTKYSLDVYQNTFFGELAVPLKVPEMTDIIITGQLSSTPNVTASASFGLILIDN